LRRATPGHVKLEDVARLANVSTATASRVINTPEAVKEKTRKRVQDAIERLGWIPHGAAKALASLRTHTVGALIPTLGHETIAAMLEAMQQTLGGFGYTVVLGNPEESTDHAIAQAAKMVQNGVECLVLMGEDHPPQLFAMLEQRNIFYLIVYTSGGYGHKNCIGFDNFREMRKIVEHLLSLGHTRFGIITRNFANNDRLRLRVEAIRDTLSAGGLAVRPQHVKITNNWRIAAGRDAMQAMLAEKGDRPTAVICTNDYLATGALIEAKAAGLRVPQDISITGFDDVELARHADPPLTTVHVPAAEMGRTVAQHIIDTLGGLEPEIPSPLEAQLVLRESTAPPPRA
jgi:LacI family transcriptional regulator